MQAITKTKEFNAELVAAMGCVETKTNLPTTGLIHVQAKGGNVILTATNLDVGFRSRVPATDTEEGAFLVDASKLNTWSSRVEGDELSIKLNKRASFKSGKSNCSIACDDVNNFPPFPAPENKVCTISASDLAEVLTGVMFVVENFETQNFNYAGVQLVFADEITAVATNGNRLAVSRKTLAAPANGGGFKGLISRKAAIEILKVAKRSTGDVQIAGSSNNMFFNFGNRLIYCRLLKDNFPKWSSVLPDVSKQMVAKIDSEAAMNALLRVAVLSEESKRVVISIDAGIITIESSSSLSEGADYIDAEYEGESVQIAISSQWLADALKYVGGKADFAFTGTGCKLVEIRKADDMLYRNVIGTMNLAVKSQPTS